MVNSNPMRGPQYAVKKMFDSQYPYLINKDYKKSYAMVLSTSYQANTGASGGSLSRIFRGNNQRLDNYLFQLSKK